MTTYGVLMYGPGYDPGPAPWQLRRPPTVRLVAVRLAFVVLSLMSIGLLAWVPLLRLAMLTRRRPDWQVFWCGAVATVAAIVLVAIESEDETTWRSMTGAALLLLSATGCAAYYLYGDVRHYDIRTYRGAHGGHGTLGPTHVMGGASLRGGPPQGPPPQSAYGHPGPYAAPTPARQGPYGPPPHTPAPQSPYGTPPPTPVPMTPAAPASAGPATPGRIDQVRAELDELSDFLRRRPGQAGQPGLAAGAGTPLPQSAPPASAHDGHWGPAGTNG